MHTYMHTYIHTYVYIHTYIHTYIRVHIPWFSVLLLRTLFESCSEKQKGAAHPTKATPTHVYVCVGEGAHVCVGESTHVCGEGEVHMYV